MRRVAAIHRRCRTVPTWLSLNAHVCPAPRELAANGTVGSDCNAGRRRRIRRLADGAAAMETSLKAMSMKMFFVSCTAIAFLSGCAAMAPAGPSGEPSRTPPQIVFGKDSKLWDNPALFGDAPPNLQTIGDARCQDAEFGRATGYHPKALDENGDRFQGGGFYCFGRKERD
jgi:hypothetical protein